MTRDETLREIQRRIAAARGYTDFRYDAATDNLCAVQDGDAAAWAVPKWSQDWGDAGELLDQMTEAGVAWTIRPHSGNIGTVQSIVSTRHASEAAARCWCAWKGIDLSDLP